MVRTDSDIIKSFLESIREDLARSQDEKGLKASGKSMANTYVFMKSSKVGQIIDGLDVFKYQETPGRGPTKNTGDGKLVDIIYEWLQYKKYGLAWNTEKQRKSLAWAITNKIHKKGTYIHIKSKRTNVVTDAINNESIDAVGEEFADKYGEILADSVVNALLDKKQSSQQNPFLRDN
jgi:hypothetical protein